MKFSILTLALALLVACSAQERRLANEAYPIKSRCLPCEEAMSREERGFRNDAFAPEIDQLRKNHPKPEPDVDYKINPYQLLSAIRTMVARDQDLARRAPGEATVTNHLGQPIPLEVFRSLRRQLKRIFWKRFDLTEEEGAAFAENIVRDALVVSRITEKAWIQAGGEGFPTEKDMTQLVKQGSDKLWRTSTLETRYDVPYVAGYAPDDPHFIFIDRNVPAEGSHKGKKIRAHFLLNVHERVEKILLDEMGLTYQHAHQIAQRTERRVAHALGISWDEYDQWISKVADKVSSERPLRIHPRLDMTCYYSYDDEENLKLVAEMEESKRRHR